MSEQLELPIRSPLEFHMKDDCSTTRAKCGCGFKGTIDDYECGDYTNDCETCFCPACHVEYEVVWK